MCQEDRRRHVIRVFVGRVAEHHALIAGSARVDTHGDIAGLLVDAGDHCAGIGVEPVEGIVITDGGDHTAHQRLEIDVSLGGNFAGDNNQAGCGQSLTGHTAVNVFFQAGIENRVGNLIGDLIRMPFRYRFRGKQIAFVRQNRTPFMVSHSGRYRANQLDTVILRSVEAFPKRIASNWETPNILRPKGAFRPFKGAKSALNLLPEKTPMGTAILLTARGLCEHNSGQSTLSTHG